MDFPPTQQSSSKRWEGQTPEEPRIKKRADTVTRGLSAYRAPLLKWPISSYSTNHIWLYIGTKTPSTAVRFGTAQHVLRQISTDRIAFPTMRANIKQRAAMTPFLMAAQRAWLAKLEAAHITGVVLYAQMDFLEVLTQAYGGAELLRTHLAGYVTLQVKWNSHKNRKIMRENTNKKHHQWHHWWHAKTNSRKTELSDRNHVIVARMPQFRSTNKN